MALRGCVRIDGLPLQILLNDNPSWRGTPVAVTREVKPQSPILALNREARQRGLALGMRYANALALVPSLRAREVPADQVASARELIIRTLHALTPDVEPCTFDVDAFWVSLQGLTSLFGTDAQWIARAHRALSARGFTAHIAAGFTRFGTYALARGPRRSVMLASRDEELAQVGGASIEILPVPRRAKDTLVRLEVRTLRQFALLPAGEILRRFGRDAAAVRELMLTDDPLPIQPAAVKDATCSRRHLDAPLRDLDLLLPLVYELLQCEVRRVEAERSVVSELCVVLRAEEGETFSETIRPAAPTLNAPVLCRLVRLRLEGLRFSSGVEDIEVRCARAAPSRTQEELFAARGRDLRAGARAFAAIRARFGNLSVAFACLEDSHLPERSFTWAAAYQPSRPAPRSGDAPVPRPAVRRIFFEPKPLVPGRDRPRVLAGPFAVSGAWWGDAPFRREYSYGESRAGILWQFVDETGTAWVQGIVD